MCLREKTNNMLLNELQEYNLYSYNVTVEKVVKKTREEISDIEEVVMSLLDMPVEYSLGHCVAKDMHMSAGIAIEFKLLNKHFKRKIYSDIYF